MEVELFRRQMESMGIFIANFVIGKCRHRMREQDAGAKAGSQECAARRRPQRIRLVHQRSLAVQGAARQSRYARNSPSCCRSAAILDSQRRTVSCAFADSPAISRRSTASSINVWNRLASPIAGPRRRGNRPSAPRRPDDQLSLPSCAPWRSTSSGSAWATAAVAGGWGPISRPRPRSSRS